MTTIKVIAACKAVRLSSYSVPINPMAATRSGPNRNQPPTELLLFEETQPPEST